MATKSPKSPVKSEAPSDPNLLGQANELELQNLQKLQQQKINTLVEIANCELRKQALMRGLDTLDEGGRHLLNGIESRLGLPEGVTWSVNLDGRIVRTPTP